MLLTTLELTNAREIVRDLLEQLHLEAYLFEIEPKAPPSQWQLRLDCGLGEQWQSLLFEVDYEQLKASKAPGQARQALLEDWQKNLRACARCEHA